MYLAPSSLLRSFTSSLSRSLISLPQRARFSRWIVSLLALIGVAHAATFTVTSTDDTGTGTLRAAVVAANTAGGTNTITFGAAFAAPGPYTIQLDSVLPDLASNLTITGPGANVLTIRGEGTWFGFGNPDYYRLFKIPAGLTVNISGLTISNFRAAGATGVNGPSATAGSPGYGGAIYNSGTLTLTDCAFSGNAAQGGAGGSGDRNDSFNPSNTVPAQNGAAGSDGFGGAIYSDGSALSIVRCTFAGGRDAGGNYVSGNMAQGGTGGGGNSANYGALGTGGPAGSAWGGAIYIAATAGTNNTIANSTFYGDMAVGGSGGGGGALSSGSGAVGGHGGNGTAGAIYAAKPVTITSCTITGCAANPGNGGYNGNGSANAAAGTSTAGALYSTGATITVGNSLVAANTVQTSFVQSQVTFTYPTAESDVVGTFASQNFNLIGAADGVATFTGAADQKGTVDSPIDPKVDPLGALNNGGPTSTVRLRKGSPAVDKGKDLSSLLVDQRGNSRPKLLDNAIYPDATGGDGSDIGAFESQALPNDLPVITSATTMIYGAQGTVITTLSNSTQGTAQGTNNQLVATDADNDTLTFSIVSGTTPPGLVFNANGTITGTPTAPAQTSLTYKVNDGLADSATATLQFFIKETAGLIVTTDIDNSTDYDGLTSLREALNHIYLFPSNPTITFDATFFATAKTITTNSNSGAFFLYDSSVTINGPAAGLTLSGGNATVVFQIYGGGSVVNVAMKDLTIANGLASGFSSGGGGIQVSNGGSAPTVTFTNCTFRNNVADNLKGGAILNGSDLFGATAGGAVTLINCTLAGNHADGASSKGGAIYQVGGTLTLQNCTVALNHATGGVGGGLMAAAGTVNLGNSIVASNTVGTGTKPDISASVASQGYNLIGNSTGATITGTTTGNQLNVSPGLDVAGLASNGGPTPTIALAAGSLALDQGKALGGVTTDQRGQARPNDQAGIVNASGGDGSDIGAFESAVIVVAPPTVASVAVPANGTAKLGANLDFTVNWSASVTVTGTPALALTIGSTSRTASYVSGTGTAATLFRYTVQAGDLDTDGIAVGALALSGGTIKDGSSNDAVLTLAGVGSTAGVNVDGIVPTLSGVTLASNNPLNTRARTGNAVTLAFTASETISAPTVSIATHAVTATNTSGNTWSATYTLIAGDAEGPIPFSIAFADSATNAGTTVTAVTSGSGVIFDRTAPAVTAGNIALSGATGTGGAFKTGNTVTVTWNNTVTGNNNSDVASVTMDLSGFGGSATAAATNTAGSWTASVLLSAGSLDAINRNATLTVVDTTGNSTVFAGTNNAVVDNQAPVVTAAKIAVSGATGTGGVFKIGDVVTATWNNTVATGDNNADISTVTVNFSAFGGGSSVSATNSSGTWTATYTIAAGSIEASSLNVTVTATDDAGNVTATSGTNNAAVDNIAPAAPSAPDLIAASDSGSLNTDNLTNVTTPTFTGTAVAGSTVKLLDGGTLVGTATATGGNWSITSTTLGTGAHVMTATATDLAGNTGAASASLTVTIDTTAPVAPVITGIANDTGTNPGDGITTDTTLVLNGTAEAGSTVALSKGGNPIGTTTTSGSGAWSFDYTGTVLAAGDHSFTATATDVAGNTGALSNTYLVTIDTSVPVAPVIAAITSDTGTITTDGVTNDNTLVFNGTAEPNTTVTLLRNGVGSVGTATASGTGAWSFNYTATVLPDAAYIFTATATDTAGNTSAASADFPVVVDTIAPVVTASTAGGTYNSAFTYPIAATGSATIYATTTLPAGLTVNAATGVISGTPTAAGTTTVTLSATDLAGNTGTASVVITIAKALPVITWGTPAAITYGTALSGTQLNATSSVPGSFVYTPASGSFPLAGPQTLSTAFTPTDTANYLTVPATTVSLTVNQAPVTISGLAATSRIYDGGTVAAITGTPALVGLRGVDVGNVTVVGTAAGAFTTKVVGLAKPVTIAGLSLGGSAAANYVLTAPASTATISARTPTVTGITAASKTYNGSTAAALATGGATLVGIVTLDTVTVVTGGATGTFSDANVGLNKPVQVAGLTLAGPDAGNYSVLQPATTANITTAGVAITITNLNFTYDGTPKSATISLTPSAAASIVYSGSGSAPTDAGTYTVSVNVTDNNYSGSSGASLTIAKAAQSIAFSITGTNFTVGSTLGLNATASSGLPVTFSVTAGNASISGSSVTITQAGAVTIRATQAGNANYLAATADQSFTGVTVTKTAQTILFAALADHTTDDGAFNLSATASSGLSVTFTIMSGPATLVGNTLLLSGTSGPVTVRASQAGNSTFAAAPDVTQSFNVTSANPDTFFGDLTDDPGTFGAPGRGELIQDGGPRPDAKSGDIAAVLYPGTPRRVNVIIVAPSLSLNVSLDFTLNADGSYSVPFSSAGRSLVLTGNLNGTTLTGRIAALRVGFSTAVQARTGATTAIAGFYQSESVNTSTGATTSIVGPNGQLLIIASAGNVTTGSVGTIAANGAFTVTAPGATITGVVDAKTTSMAGTISVSGQAPVSFSGLSGTTARTDRLINLSSRARISAAAGRTLITGFVIGGTDVKRVLLRAVGPGLTGFGVTGALVNPKLQLFDTTGKVILENDDWSGADTAAAFTQVGAFALSAGAKDAAILASLAPGAYSMQVTAGAETGTGLAEIYDASATAGTDSQRLINISTRGTVDVGPDGLLIGGFVVTGNSPKKVLIRGVGPGLTAFGVAGALVDPRLAVYSGSTLVAQNDDWSVPSAVTAQQTIATAAEISAAATSAGAFALGANAKDSAILVTLAPGAYTAQVTGAIGQTGVALVEIYEVP